MTAERTQPPKEKKESKQNGKPSRKLLDSTDNYAKYLSAGIQIISPVILGVLVGLWLDDHFDKEKPVFTITLSSVMIVVALYLFIKQFFK